jgi:hypothetical protein
MLFTAIDTWVSDTGMKLRREEITINEEQSGQYIASRLIIEDASGKKVADISPVAAFVIAADGRLDLNGTVDKAIIVRLQQGGPSFTTSVHHGNQTDTNTTYLYKGVDKNGWYMIDDSRRAKAHFVDKELFFELLSEVSDYEQSKAA